AGRAHFGERVETLLIGAGGDDGAVIFRRGVEVVVVVIEPRAFQPLRLWRAEHAKRDTGFHAEFAHAFDHGADLIEIAVLRFAPGGTHAEPAGAGGLGRARLAEHGVKLHQLAGLEPGLMRRALRAIAA